MPTHEKKEIVTFGTGDVVENPVTEERVEIRLGAEKSSGELSVAEVFVRPGSAVVGVNVHSVIEEW